MQLGDFTKILERGFPFILGECPRVAVAVSGGPDSMALCALLARWADAHGVEVHALTVDHGLREGSAEEARQVGADLADFSCVQHHILTWENPSARRVQEEARKARYALMAEYCAAQRIGTLFLAHHRDDQAETVLFRLAKGSGLDGLCGMREVYDYSDDLKLCRPLLGVSKDDLIAVCETLGVSYVDDPSNESEDYARVRLRKSRAVLEDEGLTAKRLVVSAKRLVRARDALDEMAEKAYIDAIQEKNTKQVVFKTKSLLGWPEEIMLRAVIKAMQGLRPGREYAPRMEKIEDLVFDLIHEEVFRKRTLGGVIIERDDKDGVIKLVCE